MSNPNLLKRIDGAKVRHFRHHIKAGRVFRIMSQHELAEGICSVEMLKQIEANQAVPSPQVIENIASKLEVGIEELEFDEGEA